MNRSMVQPIKRDEIVGYWERLDLDAEEVILSCCLTKYP